MVSRQPDADIGDIGYIYIYIYIYKYTHTYTRVYAIYNRLYFHVSAVNIVKDIK